MRIQSIDAVPVRLPRDLDAAFGSAGSPARLEGQGEYRWAATYPCMYSTGIETALVRVRLEGGEEGWGEAQAPVAPEVACAIVERILRPAIAGEEFDATPCVIARLWDRMYSAMRVRGQTGGFMLDAISGVDLALWDLAGKLAGASVGALLGASRSSIPAYLSGIPGDRWDSARRWFDQGIRRMKLYYRAGLRELLDDIERANEIFGAGAVGVDALWRLDPRSSAEFCREMERRRVLFLECPFPPEEIEWHIQLAQSTPVPLAIGESYRTCYELRRLVESRALAYLQPDLGRSGITEGLRIAGMAREHGVAVLPHVSIAQAPQLAAAIHFAAAVPECSLLEFNPTVLEAANRNITQPIEVREGAYLLPQGPGLGVQFHATVPWISSHRQ
jgi:D-galactarolactone cycloisomerase